MYLESVSKIQHIWPSPNIEFEGRVEEENTRVYYVHRGNNRSRF